jgi:hypothetical protein
VIEQHISLQIAQQVVGSGQVIRVAAGQVETDRIVERTGRRVDLGGQSSAATSGCLIRIDYVLHRCYSDWYA